MIFDYFIAHTDERKRAWIRTLREFVKRHALEVAFFKAWYVAVGVAAIAAPVAFRFLGFFLGGLLLGGIAIVYYGYGFWKLYQGGNHTIRANLQYRLHRDDTVETIAAISKNQTGRFLPVFVAVACGMGICGAILSLAPGFLESQVGMWVGVAYLIAAFFAYLFITGGLSDSAMTSVQAGSSHTTEGDLNEEVLAELFYKKTLDGNYMPILTDTARNLLSGKAPRHNAKDAKPAKQKEHGSSTARYVPTGSIYGPQVVVDPRDDEWEEARKSW